MLPSAKDELARSGLTASDHLLFVDDLDHGLEWCEEQMLEKNQITKMHFSTYLGAQLADLGFQSENTVKLTPYLERIQLAEGDYLIRQGEAFSDLYFIELGQVSVYLELEEGKRVRVQTPSMGTIVGELGFYLDVPRSASVIADMNTIAYRLTRKAMEEMKVKDPELAIAFNDLMLQVIAERLVTTNRELVALNR
jgi:SulP family sulfate permease